MAKKAPVLSLLGLLFLMKAGYLIFGAGLSRLGYIEREYGACLESYLDMAMRKDAGWYERIAKEGYPEGEIQPELQSAWAFFPAYPWFNQWLSDIFRFDYRLAAFWSSLVFSAAALTGFYLFCKSYWPEGGRAFFSALVIFVFPFHFYFSMFLTEGPFFAFLIWSFYAIRKKQAGWLGLLLVPLVLLRPNGLLMMLPLYLYYLEQHAAPLARFYQRRESYLAIFLFLPGMAAFIAFSFFQHRLTGEYFAFSAAQQGWGKEFMFPLLALFRRGDFNYQFTSWYVIVAGLLVIFFRKKWPASMHVLIAISILLPLSAGSAYSMVRYLSVVFPVFMVIAGLLYRIPGRPLVLLLLYLIQLGTFYLWLADYPVGF